VLGGGNGSSAVAGASGGAGDEEGEEAMDEDDPLWKAFLALACGDKAKATAMLEEPDSYMHLPEITAAMAAADAAAGAAGGEDWDADNAPIAAVGGGAAAEDAAAEPVKAVAKPAAIVKSPAKGGAADDMDEEEAFVEEVEAEEDPREHLNLVFIGHVDAGKSTLSGNILYLTGMVDKKMIEKFEREAKQRNRESWFLAFIMDTSEEERAKGKTVEVGRAHFSTAARRYTVLDAPGHKSYVPNMISGASQADIGVLVVSARKNEFEAGFDKGGQTKEHAMLAKTLGVKTLVVVVNKMDDPSVKWSKERYDEITSKLKPFLKSCGFTVRTEVKILPISALNGANITEQVSPEVCPWWAGYAAEGLNNTDAGTLVALLDTCSVEGRDPTKPLRIPVLDRYYDRGTVVLGKVESGTLAKGDTVVLLPTKATCKVDALYTDETPVKSVKPGDNVALRVNLSLDEIAKGFMICKAKEPPAVAVNHFLAFLYLADLTDTRQIFTAGYDCVLHTHTVECEVVAAKLVSVYNAKTKKEDLNPPYAKQGQGVTCVLSVKQSIVVDTYANSQALGRLTLRDEGKTIAVGKVLKLLLPRPKA